MANGYGGHYDAGLVPDYFVAVRGTFTTADYVPEDLDRHSTRRRRNTWTEPQTLDHCWPTITQNYLRTYCPDDFYFPRKRKLTPDRDDGHAFGIYRGLGPDTLRFWFTGAASDGAAQADAAGCLGNYRSSTEATRVGVILPVAIAGVRVDLVSRFTADDPLQPIGVFGNLVAVGTDQLAFTATDGSRGPAVALAVGDTRQLVDGTDPSRFVRVTRVTADDFVGLTALELDDQTANLFGGADADDSETTAGRIYYAACMLRGESLAAPVLNLRCWLEPNGSDAVSSSGQLGSSGGGTIAGAAYCFAGWEQTGWCWIFHSNRTTLREIVYYFSRTDDALTVLAAHRGRLGTLAAAGAADDILVPAAGMRIAFETPSPVVNGPIQTIANSTTAPTGVSWSTGISSTTGLGPVNLPTGGSVGLWIERDLPPGANGYAQHPNHIGVSYTVGDTNYRETLGGIWRAAVDALDRYELYVGTDAEPDLSLGPTATNATLPWTPATSFAADHVYYLVVQRRNHHNLVTASLETTRLAIVGGVEGLPPPSAPTVQVFEAAASGSVRLAGIYYYPADGTAAADQWLVYLKTGGSAPNPAIDTPTVVTIRKAFGAGWLDATYGAYAPGTVVKALLRVRRSADSIDSTNTTAVGPVTATTTTPAAPTGSVHQRGQAEQL